MVEAEARSGDGKKDEQEPISVLVVDDEESMRHFLERALTRRGFAVRAVPSAAEALSILEDSPVDVLVTDIRMPGMDGHELFRLVTARFPGTRTVLMTAFGAIKDAVEAMRLGAESYLTKPFETEELILAVERASERARLLAENRILRSLLDSKGSFAGIVGQSRVMKRLYRTIEQVAKRSGTVLIGGESGTGKELVARALHARSSQAKGPFIAVHCGALPSGLIESELFGVEQGAFTGADRPRAGYVERAQGGSLFLDEISEVPLEVQPSLLRFLESGEMTRVGGSELRRPAVRIVAASHRDLREMVEGGRFRADLYFRLAVLPIHVPPLRERAGDIPLLIAHFLKDFGRMELEFPAEVIALLESLPFPGNVRELRNLVERMASTVEGERVEVTDLPPELRGVEGDRSIEFRPYRLALEAFERDYLLSVLQRTGGNISEAARLGGISRPSLHARIAALDIDVSKLRTPNR